MVINSAVDPDPVGSETFGSVGDPDRMFLGLPDPDPDPLVRGTDPAPDLSPFSPKMC
jgi:hypothetical protein